MYDRCLRCDYALVCMSVEGTDIVRCAQCGSVDVIVKLVGRGIGIGIGVMRATEKLCDIVENTACKCSDIPYRDYVRFGEKEPSVLCDKCTEEIVWNATKSA